MQGKSDCSHARYLAQNKRTFHKDFFILRVIELDCFELEVGVDLLEDEGFGREWHGWSRRKVWF